jgi:hypothetical protein
VGASAVKTSRQRWWTLRASRLKAERALHTSVLAYKAALEAIRRSGGEDADNAKVPPATERGPQHDSSAIPAEGPARGSSLWDGVPIALPLLERRRWRRRSPGRPPRGRLLVRRGSGPVSVLTSDGAARRGRTGSAFCVLEEASRLRRARRALADSSGNDADASRWAIRAARPRRATNTGRTRHRALVGPGCVLAASPVRPGCGPGTGRCWGPAAGRGGSPARRRRRGPSARPVPPRSRSLRRPGKRRCHVRGR